MKRLLFAVALAIAPMSLAACATTGSAPASAHMTVGKTISAAASTLKFAEDQAALRAGQLTPAEAKKMSDDIKLAHAVLTSAYAVYRADPTADVTAQIAQASALAAEILRAAQAHK